MGEHGASDGDGGTQPKEKQGVDDAVPDKICEFVREQLPPEKIQKIAHDAVGRLVQEGVAEWVTEERVGTELKTAINEATRQASEDQQIQDDLASVRQIASGWLTAVTAVVGVFGVAGIVFTGGATTGLSKPQTTLFIVLAAIAAIAGFASIALGTFAAHGWPRVRWTSGNRKADKASNRAGKYFAPFGPPRPRDRGEALAKAIVGLISSLSAAAFSAATFFGAAVIIWTNK